MNDLRTRLTTQRVLPVLRTPSADEAVATARTLHDVGLDIVELTTTVPNVHEAIARLRSSGITVGLGTVRHPDEVAAAARAGASFVVSYCNPPGFVAAARDAGVVAIPGALTPTEVQAAADDGADLVKLFPAWATDARMIHALEPLVRDVGYLATGSIDEHSLGEWLTAGAVAVGTGSGLGSHAPDEGQTLRANALRMVAAAERARP